MKKETVSIADLLIEELKKENEELKKNVAEKAREIWNLKQDLAGLKDRTHRRNLQIADLKKRVRTLALEAGYTGPAWDNITKDTVNQTRHLMAQPPYIPILL